MRPSRPLLLPLLLVSGLTACQPQTESATPVAASSTAAAPTAPVPTRGERINSAAGPLELRTIASTLVNPWGLAFLPDGRMLVTERIGQLRIVESDGSLSAPLSGVPAVVAEGQGGLFDVALSPDFAADSLVYLSYAEPGEGKLAGTSVARGRLTESGLADVQVIFQQSPKLDTRHHFGGRLVFDDAGMLYITMGDRGVRPTAQDLSSHMGTVARIHPDGRVPEDNPFIGRDGAKPEIWSYGHRNEQGLAINPATGVLWEIEHGPRGGDEVNIIGKGRNYGWPVIGYGIDYSGAKIHHSTSKPGMEQPIKSWVPSIAPSGMAFYTGRLFPKWDGSLFTGALAGMMLVRLSLHGDAVTGEERLLQNLNERIRDVRQGPDGALWLVTDSSAGRVLRVAPAGK